MEFDGSLALNVAALGTFLVGLLVGGAIALWFPRRAKDSSGAPDDKETATTSEEEVSAPLADRIGNLRASIRFRLGTSGMVGTLVQIGKDLILTLAILASLSVVHLALPHVSASDDFKALFSRIHESVYLAMYLVLALKSLLRMVVA